MNFVDASPFRIRYPAPVRFKPKFTEEPLDVYEGTILITAAFMKGALDGTTALHATVTAQACTDQICRHPRICRFRSNCCPTSRSGGGPYYLCCWCAARQPAAASKACDVHSKADIQRRFMHV